MQTVFEIFLILTAVVLILIILVQRGKGGGLAGAFGGMGGQSAFGTKAGDLFTRITIGVAAVWIVLCLCSVAFLRKESRLTGVSGPAGRTTQQAPADQPGRTDPGALPPSGPANP